MKHGKLLLNSGILLLAAAIYLYEKNKNRLIKITDIDYGEEITYVTGHKNPDADSVGSAIAYAQLLNRLGIKAKAVLSGKINKETQYFMKKFGIPVPDLIDEVSDRQFVLVDHNSYAQAIDGIKEARVITIIDHHEKGDISTKDVPFIRLSDHGATASMIYQMYKEYEVPIDENIARVLFMSIISDTKNLKKINTTVLDKKAYHELLEIAGIEDPETLYEEMCEAAISYEGMSDREIFYEDLKEYETAGIRYAITAATAKDHEAMIDLIDRLYAVAEKEYEKLNDDYIFIKVRDRQSDAMYMTALNDEAVKLLESIYFNYDGNKYFIFDVSLSRKLNLVPMIDTAIKEKKKTCA